MRLRTIELENIRSYQTAKVDLQDGITLLSGDIGSGKSTLLIAVEFALFGLQRGELTGAALLRHGCARGKVIVTLETRDTTYKVCRTLKRTSRAIVQDTGWLEHDGQRTELTANELKAKVFEILGYPLQFLQRKNLLYTFTVYTQQEEMKKILAQQPQERIETIRRVFGVDAYKTMRDNAQLVARELKSKASGKDEMAERIAHEKERLQERIADAKELSSKIEDIRKRRASVRDALGKAEEELERRDAAYRKLESERQMVAMKERARKNLQEEIARLQELRDKKRAALAAQEKALSEMTERLKVIPGKEEDAAERLQERREHLSELQRKEGRVAAIMDQCSVPDVEAGRPCPLCRQQVGHDHLDTLEETLKAKLEAAKKKRARTLDEIERARKDIGILEERIERHRERKELSRRAAEQADTVERAKEDIRELDATLEEKMRALAELPEQEDFDDSSLKEHSLKVREAKARVAELREQAMTLEKKAGGLEKEMEELQSAKDRLGKLRNELKALQEEKKFYLRTREWMLERFSKFTTLIEQRVLMTIHSTFDAAFRDWFMKLVEDDTLSARLDMEFSPSLEQNGYETDVAFLSGGERTAVALAYRLAFVHTIHVLLPDLGTAGVIMLDEPTDGFSAEQLVRMQDVLRDLDMGQVILVSHEEQLEAFADNIVHVSKRGGLSSLETKAL